MKRGGMMRKRYELILIGIIFFSILIGCVSAFKVTNSSISNLGNSYIVKEDSTHLFNFSLINNTFGNNITWVNITIDSTFAYKSLSNGTSASSIGGAAATDVIFTNTTSMLTWMNLSSIVRPDGNSSFWFNATPSTPGTYTFTVVTANSSQTLNTSTLSITVLEIHNVMTTTGTYNFSTINEDTIALFNITLNNTPDVVTGNITNITVSFPSTFKFTSGSDGAALTANGTTSTAATFTNTSTSLTWINNTVGLVTNLANGSVWFNLTATEPGNHNIIVTTVNSQDSGVHIQTFTVSVRDITAPGTFAYNCTKLTGISEGETAPTCQCTAVDNYDSTPTISYEEPVTTNAGTYTIYCTATDDTGNTASTSVSYVVEASSGGDYTSGTGGGTYTMTYLVTDTQFKQGYTTSMAKNERAKVTINNIEHQLAVNSLTPTTASITVSSTPINAVLSIGDERKFDVTADGYYDIYVKLNSITNSKANITMKSIYEKATTETAAQEQEKQIVAEEDQQSQATLSETKSKVLGWILAGIVIILVVGGIIYWVKGRK